jgi:hypothetical protein
MAQIIECAIILFGLDANSLSQFVFSSLFFFFLFPFFSFSVLVFPSGKLQMPTLRAAIGTVCRGFSGDNLLRRNQSSGRIEELID